ncbi:MAG: DNA polymerase I [Clostridia bacterium]|nr:DNA polymerase I [Clostridia bacterium]
MKKLLAVDGNSILNRAFYGVRPLTTKDGRNTNAIFGFINMLYKQISELKPDYAAIAFDLREPTFRHEKCAYYKATRHGMPPELAEQLEPAKKIASLMGFRVLTSKGYEADDILGTLSLFASDDLETYVMTGDRDSFQLIGKNSYVLYVTTKDTLIYDEKKIAENYGGNSPKQLIDVKSLMGDASDNIPGVPGIGEKTAVDLISKYKSLDNLYKELESGNPEIKGAVRTKLENSKTSAYESRFLAEICKTVPLGITLSDLGYNGIDKKNLLPLCVDFELNSVISRLKLDDFSSETEKNENVSVFETTEKVLECKEIPVSEIPEGLLFVYPDFDNHKIYFSPGGGVFSVPETDSSLSKVFESENIKTVLHNLKEIQLYCSKLGKDVKNCVFDALLASYAANPSKVITAENLHSYNFVAGVDSSKPGQKAILCVKSLEKAYSDLLPVIKENGQENLLYGVEMPLSKVLAEMEETGFKLNVKKLAEYSLKLDENIAGRKEKIYELAGKEFNINSTKQLADVLFNDLGLPAQRKNKSGYSTDAETLEKLRPYHKIIDEILEYRVVSKLKSTYTDALISVADENGRIHTKFKQAFTLTGRLSSAEPNLQNIPIRTKEGGELRKFFEAKDPSYVLIDADYSQIELRLMAIISGDENMLESYRQGKDIHASTASQVFGIPYDAITPELRKKAKAVNFGIIYGISDFSLAGDLHVTRREAGEYIKSYFANFPKIKSYLDSAIAAASEKGYSETLYARRRYIPELSAKNKNLRAFGERVAMNAPIQGTAADIIKIAMLNVDARLKKEKLDAKLVLQVHDELIIEAKKEDAEAAKRVLKEEMENVADFGIPLEVSVGTGFTWAEAHE